MSTPLDQALLAAHAADDRAALVGLYTRAADEADAEEARAFYLTHAMIFALDVGAPEASALRAKLIAMDREAPAEV